MPPFDSTAHRLTSDPPTTKVSGIGIVSSDSGTLLRIFNDLVALFSLNVPPMPRLNLQSCFSNQCFPSLRPVPELFETERRVKTLVGLSLPRFRTEAIRNGRA